MRLGLIITLAVLVSCAPRLAPIEAQHPGHPDATTGRLAGPPPALRAGMAASLLAVPSPAEPEAVADPHAAHGSAPSPPPVKSADQPAIDEPRAPAKKPPAKKPPAKQSPTKKPPPKQPATPVKRPPPEPPTDHSGHQGAGGGS